MRANNRIVVAVLFSTLIGNATASCAAEQPPADAAEPDLSEDQTAEEMLAAEAALEAQETTTSPDAGESDASDPSIADAAETDEPTPGLADEDFVPTIQISEDLSVSFPVDI